MKNLTTFIARVLCSLFLVLFWSISSHAQAPVIVNAPGCEYSGTYEFAGIINGKNSYTIDSDFFGGDDNDNTDTKSADILATIYFGSGLWTMSDGDIGGVAVAGSDVISTSVLPPCDGWTSSICSGGISLSGGCETVPPEPTCFPAQSYNTSGVHTYTLPAGADYLVKVTATGAPGGQGFLPDVGFGATIEGTFEIPGGTTLYAIVGEQGIGIGSSVPDVSGGGGGGSGVTDGSDVLLVGGAGAGSGLQIVGGHGQTFTDCTSQTCDGLGGVSIISGGGGFFSAGTPTPRGGGQAMLTTIAAGGVNSSVLNLGYGGAGFGGGGAGFQAPVGSFPPWGGGGGGYKGGVEAEGGFSYFNLGIYNASLLQDLPGSANGPLASVQIECVNIITNCNNPDVPQLSASPTTVCPGESVNITLVGDLNDATEWAVYSGSCGGTPVLTTTSSNFTVTPNGTTQYFVRGEGGDCVTPGACASITITADDTQAPAALCQDVTVQLDANGNGTIAAADVDAGSNDACGAVSLSLNMTTVDCDFGSGAAVSYQAYQSTTATGNQAWQGELGMAFDVLSPITIDALGTFDHASDGINGAGVRVAIFDRTSQTIVTGLDATLSGAAAPLVANHRMQSIPSVVLPVGQYMVVVKGYNPAEFHGNGLLAATATDDGQGAIQFVGSSAYGPNNPSGFSYPGTTDVGPANRYLAGSFSFSTEPANTVTLTVTDDSGNTATCNSVVTVQDGIPPVITCQDLAVELDGRGAVSIDGTELLVSSSDNCGTANIVGLSQADFECADIGPNTVTLQVSDENGNTTDCTVTVTVADNAAPSPSEGTLPDVVGECMVEVTEVPTASDNCARGVDGTTTDPLSYDQAGTYTITWTFDDGNGNAVTQTQTVIVEDNTAPVITCQDLAVELDGRGSVSIDGTELLVSSSDNCGTVNIVGLSLADFDCTHIGPNTVTLQVSDGNGHTTDCTVTVTVADNAEPSLGEDTLPDVVGECMVEVTEAPIAFDNCARVIEGTTSDPLTYDEVGTYIITWTYDDGNGNAVTQTQTVTVEDNTAPVITCQDAMAIPDYDGPWVVDASVVDYLVTSSSDNCGAVNFVSASQTEFSCDDLGPQALTLNFEDENGNAGSCMLTLNVVDNLAPRRGIQSGQTYELDANGELHLSPANFLSYIEDNCTEVDTSLSQTLFTCADLGEASVDLFYSDQNGNSGVGEGLTFTIVDNLAPEMVCQDITVQLDEDGEFGITSDDIIVSSSDNCGSVNVVDFSRDHFDCFDIGTKSVSITISDGNGNETSCSVTVTIEDDLAPVPQIAPLADIVGECDATIVKAPIADDNCGGIITGTTSDPSDYTEQGTYTITWTYDDGNGNTSTQTQTVIVEDNTAPVITCQDAMAIPDYDGPWVVDAGVVDYLVTSSSDNCGAVNFVSASQTEFSCDDLGPQALTLNFEDENGNAGSCTLTLNVVDNLAPRRGIQSGQTYELDANGELHLSPANFLSYIEDNCTEVDTSLSQTLFTCADLGEASVDLFYSDQNGNSGVGEGLTFTIVDNLAPEMVCQDITVQLDEDGEFGITSDDIIVSSSDNCGSVNVVDFSRDHFDCFDIGTKSVSITISDGNGNETSCSVTVTIEDALPPVPQVATLADVAEECEATVDAPLADDNCGGVISGTTSDPTVYTEQGTYTITWTYDDVNGNTSTQTQTIVVEDQTSPEVVCTDLSVQLDATGQVSITSTDVYASGSDNCGTVNIVGIDLDIFTCDDLGTTQVTLTANDGNGNTGNCIANVTITDFDSDNDGTSDCFDNCPDNPNLTDPGVCGCDDIGTCYCVSEGESQQYEWIKRVRLASIDNTSGNNGGYADFTSVSTDLDMGSNNLIRLRPGYSGQSFREYWQVWIDLNQDGNFDDPGERVFRKRGFGNVSGQLYVPLNALSGPTRMRISMQYNHYAGPCETFQYGEVEDYTVNLIGEDCGPLPSDWYSQDIGYAPSPGMACYDSDSETYSVSSAGYDIFGSGDECHFAYTEFCGDGEIIARVNDITNSGDFALAGVMMRANLSGGSKYAGQFMTAEEGSVFQARFHQNAHTFEGYDAGAAPVWLKLQRVGNTFTGFTSADGVNWTATYYAQVNMPNCLKVGLGVSSYTNNGDINTSIFDNVSIIPASSKLTDDEGILSSGGGTEALLSMKDEREFRGQRVVNDTAVEDKLTLHANDQMTVKQLDVYPNPATDKVTILLSGFDEKQANVLMSDQLGKVVWQKSHAALVKDVQTIDLNTNQFIAGIYTITVISGDDVVTKRLVISK